MTDSGDLAAPPDDSEPAPGELDGAGRKRNGRERHAYWRAQRLLRDRKVRERVLFSGRTAVGKQYRAEHAALVTMAGGEDKLTATMRHAIDEIVRLRLFQSVIDTFLIERESNVVNRRKRVAAPILETRLRLSDSLGRHVDRLEAAIAANKAVGQNDIAASWARTMDALIADEEREEIERELARRRKRLAATSDVTLELRAGELERQLGPMEERQRHYIELQVDHEQQTDNSQEAQVTK